MSHTKGAETVEMVDGRVYYSRDHWQTIWLIAPGSKRARKVTDKQEAGMVRLYVGHGAVGLTPEQL